MLRFFAGVGSALLLVAAASSSGPAWPRTRSDPVPDAPAGAEAAPRRSGRAGAARPRPTSARKEQRRFDRADRDNDGRITLEELLYPRRRAFQRLDTNATAGSRFEEWAVRTARPSSARPTPIATGAEPRRIRHHRAAPARRRRARSAATAEPRQSRRRTPA